MTVKHPDLDLAQCRVRWPLLQLPGGYQAPASNCRHLCRRPPSDAGEHLGSQLEGLGLSPGLLGIHKSLQPPARIYTLQNLAQGHFPL